MTLEQCVEKFLRTVQENPGLPVYCWVDNEVVCDDTADRWLGEITDCRVADVAVYNGEWYGDQDELIEAYYAQHEEEYEGWHGVDVDFDIIRRTEHLWHKVILVNVDLQVG